MFIFRSLTTTALVALVAGAPLKLGIHFEDEGFEKRSSMPLLSLPYGTWQAHSYDSGADIYTFKNIRYAAPPVGDLRWAKPAPPTPTSGVQDGSYGPICIQSAPNGLNLLGPGDESLIGGAANQFLAGIPVALFSGGNEDCLFLDVYVPGSAVRNPSEKLPVVAWIYGGAYLFGSKDSFEALEFYDGSGLINESGGNMIFVAMNYRLGAFGFLGGSTMESEGLPNAGLWDQRAAMQWIQDYIHLLGGDPTQVTIMGESAGAGSILHHLVATETPLFSKAILQSPAYEFIWDRKGTMESIFNEFASDAGCAGQGVSCLRAASSATLTSANSAMNSAQPDGSFAVGPAPDGSFIRQLAPLELASGNFHNNIPLIISHTSDEATLFVDGHIQTDSQFNTFVDAIFPAYAKSAGVNTLIEQFYPPVSTNQTYPTETDRVKAFIRDSSFTCNTRFLTEAYGDSNVYNMQYSVSPGYHATDLLPTFHNPEISVTTFLEDLAFSLVTPLFAGIANAYKSYLTSFVRTGNPNTYRAVVNIPSAIQWDHPSSAAGEQIQGVLNVGDWGFSMISDAQNEKTPCGFWREVAAAVTALGGYAPPGAVVGQGLVGVSGDPSGNY